MSPAPGATLRRLVLLACVLPAAGVAAPIVRGPEEHHERWLHGTTEQGHPLALLLDESGRLRGVGTRIDAVCRSGHPWHVNWSPREDTARFTQHGKRVAVRELGNGSGERGRTSRILVRLTGRLSRTAASGTVRVWARFYRNGREVQACESAPRRWAAGANAERRLANAPPVRPPRGRYYPKAPTVAGKLSASRRRFIRRTDHTCLATYGAAIAASQAVQDAAGDLALQTKLYAAYVEAHNDQLLALQRLGKPRDGVELHQRWLDNFRLRVRLERRVLRLTRAGRVDEAAHLHDRLGPLKMAGNAAGQRFGLEICTSNGPDRTPVQR